MPTPARAPVRRWQAALIVTLFALAVAGAAAMGWWYARESPPHQGPIVLVAVDGVPATDLLVYGAQQSDTPAIDALAAESVIFDRAYTHSPQSLPAHTSLLSGLLPIEHGVRDDAGFTVPADTQTLAELLQSRGFITGAAVSSFLLQRRSGVAQGFTFFDDELPAGAAAAPPTLERQGTETLDVAERWMALQNDRRFFLFVQVARQDADTAVLRLSTALKEHRLYDQATLVVVGSRGDTGAGSSLDDRALRIPLIVKQPDGEGGQRRVSSPVQHIDVLPTILDLVRAPIPGGLSGRSLRPLLDGDDTEMPEQPIYAESLAAYFRFGGQPVYALTGRQFRYVRGHGEDLVPLSATEDEAGAGEAAAAGRLRDWLDERLASSPIGPPSPIPSSEEDRYALFGHLSPWPGPSTDAALDADTERQVVDAHRAAATLIGQKRYTTGIRALQRIVGTHPTLASVRYQLGVLLARSGRLEEAIREFEGVRQLRPDAAAGARGLAGALLRAGRTGAAREQSALAVALAELEDPAARFAAHEMAARVALAEKDPDSAMSHAETAQAEDPTVPVAKFVQGRLLYDEGQFEEAAKVLEEAAAELGQQEQTLPDVHLYLGESLARLERYADAEAQFRAELLDHPRAVQAYTSLAILYRAAGRDDAVEDVLNELVAATPTPEGYGVAARLWTVLGDPSRAEALRSDARSRFRDDPSLALLGRDRRR